MSTTKSPPINNFIKKLFKNLKLKIKNLPKADGMTIVELIVVVFIVALFSMIAISDFPKIQRQFALSRAANKLSQDLRHAEDLALSGVYANDSSGRKITTLSGYGIYFDLNTNTQYIIYAAKPGSQKYESDDSIVEVIDISKDSPSLYIKSISNINGTSTSVNFTPPSPTVNINNISSGNTIGIVLGLTSDSSATKTIWVNTAGLIYVQ